MGFLYIFLQMLVMIVIVLLVYNTLRVYVLPKVKVNKWILLALSLIVFIVPSILWPTAVQRFPWNYVQSGLFIIFFLWFAEVAGLYNKSKSARKNTTSSTIIRPKAKPNRINSKDMEVIKLNKKKKWFKNKK